MNIHTYMRYMLLASVVGAIIVFAVFAVCRYIDGQPADDLLILIIACMLIVPMINRLTNEEN